MAGQGQMRRTRTEHIWSAVSPECVAKARFVGGVVVTGIFGLGFFRLPLRGDAALTPCDRGSQLLRHARCGHWWGTAYELGEPPQILCCGREQHLILSTTQASQSKPVELENALHVRKPHLDLLALAA